MRPIVFCNRCGSMKVGGNWRYIRHSAVCKEMFHGPSKLLVFIGFLSILIFVFPTSSAIVFTELDPGQTTSRAVIEASVMPIPNPAIVNVRTFLKRYEIEDSQRERVAEAIVTSSRKYSVDPLLVASIMIVESRANPFAISESDSIGIMQIHLPTWGDTADKEGINLFKVEDNVDFGVRILKDYVKRYGVWDGVKRYKGWNTADPESTQSAEAYVEKVQHVYGYEKPIVLQ